MSATWLLANQIAADMQPRASGRQDVPIVTTLLFPKLYKGKGGMGHILILSATDSKPTINNN